MSHREVAKLLQAEGWFSPKTTVYYIEYRVRRLREKGKAEDVQQKQKTTSARLGVDLVEVIDPTNDISIPSPSIESFVA
jgi:hypothetical protein